MSGMVVEFGTSVRVWLVASQATSLAFLRVFPQTLEGPV
jgi:hypothetical protein